MLERVGHQPMCTDPCTASRRSLRQLACLATAAAIAGCVAPVSEATAPMPEFTVGDSYTFDDGRTERVTAVDAAQVHWHGSGPFTFVTGHNILLPRLAWKAGDMLGRRSMDVPATALFPLSVGRRVSFASRRLVRHVNGAETNVAEGWNCTIPGTASITTEAGQFDTFRVECRLTEASNDGPQLRTFYYSPELHYFVRREDSPGFGTAARIDLVDFTTSAPPLPASVQIIRASIVQAALETRPSGEVLSWNDEAAGVRGLVRPVRTQRSADGKWCRVVEERIDLHGRQHRVQQAACRDNNGVWR